MPDNSTTKPVIYVHAKGREQVDASTIRALADLDLTICCRLAFENTVQTVNGYDQPGLLLREIAGQLPGRPVIFLRAGLQPSPQLVNTMLGILDHAEEPLALTVLSNANAALNPFAGLSVPENCPDYDFAELVELLGPGQLHALSHWSDHFAILSADLIARISALESSGTLMQQIALAGGNLKVADHLFLNDPENSVFKRLKLRPHESLCPPAFSELSSRLQEWLDSGITEIPNADAESKPATLHITHSWGGGVALWLKSFIETDNSHCHYQLRSESPHSNGSYGQKLALYAGNELRCPIASWWLKPAVSSIVDSHAGYQQALAEICQRFNINRVFISSLVGHSLDALRSGLPTLQILHDHFPLWPLLSVSPEPYLQPGQAPAIGRALGEHAKNLEFREKDPREWSQISSSYRRALDDFAIKIAAPGQSVLDMQYRLESTFSTLETAVIPHGFPAMQSLRAITPKPRKDGRLRMVVLGRMQTGKGQLLLTRALPELTRHVQVYLLGTGKSGEHFFGMPGVDVVLEYAHEDLPSILAGIGPDFAALLSVVPETFSYTLSELQQMSIPAIATRVGSFRNRIEHGKTGWLIDTEPRALVAQVAALHDSPEAIDSVRANLPGISASTPQDMVKAYNRLCPAADKQPTFIPTEAGPEQVQHAAADYQRILAGNELKTVLKEKSGLNKDLAKRTEWALAEKQQRIAAEKQRDEWVDKLDAEIFRLGVLLRENQQKFEAHHEQQRLTFEAHYERQKSTFEAHYERQKSAFEAERGHYQRMLHQVESENQRISDLNKLLMQSTSWKITRPLRVGRRLARNFMLARAWNPVRWPWLFSQLVRNLSTQGVMGTLKRLQGNGNQAAAEPKTQPQLQPKPQSQPQSQPEPKSKPQPKDDPEPVSDDKPPAAFPKVDEPKASIIIPVYNQWNYTAACLHSLLAVENNCSFEVIVVDDHSSDRTDQHLSGIDGITHLRNDQNLGFVGSCNRGAKHARGEFLVLLNNDTQVTDGWLDELINTFEREPQAGLVGARLVYPDGRLQESGGIIFNDGSGWNYGRDQEADDPRYLFTREADYCSGAAIALKTSLFQEIGAFDERYAPAYYEDTDLAFRIREAGLKVFVQPSSAVIHYEGVTSGTDTSSGTKKYQLINQEKFVERWQSQLQSQPAPVSGPDDEAGLLSASQHRNQSRILFIDATTPEPDKDSGSVRLTNLMQCCREMGYGVTFFADNRVYAGTYTQELQKTGIEVLYQPWLKSLHKFFRARGSDFDYIFISRHYIAINYLSMLKRYCPQAKFIFDTVDLHYLREQRLAELENSMPLRRTAKQTRRSEMSVIDSADVTLVVSTVEKAVLAEDAPGKSVHVLSNIHQVPGRDKPFSERQDIYFVGGYQHPPNIDAACWFVKEIWPLIREELPELRFYLIGSNAPERIKALEGNGVVFGGFVESLEPFLSNCRIAVAPLRYGAGVKGKVNMSMAHGQPVVATPTAVEGMFTEHGREVLVADDARSFAREVIRLYQDEDLWNRLSDASVRNVEEHFSIAAARASLTALFDSLRQKEDG